jgi:ketosteroid isomerase-like protein
VDNVKTTQLIYEAFGRGDVPAILDHLADDVAWDQDAPGYGVPIYEPGAGKAHVGRFFDALGGLEFERFQPMNFLGGENQVAVTIDVKVNVKVTGKSVEALEIHLWTFGPDGKITRFFHCIDRHAFVLAYGL